LVRPAAGVASQCASAVVALTCVEF